jgi:RNA polymerase sigma factor for flagellar operon FliA
VAETQPTQSPLQDDDVQTLWQRHVHERSTATRDALTMHYMPFARMHAAMLYAGRFGDDIDFADYLQLGIVALIEAIDRFDTARGVKFQTFAAYRVRGAILDGVEAFTERQRQIAARRHIQEARMASLMQTSAEEAEGAAGKTPNSAPVTDDKLLAYLAEIGFGLALGYLLEDSGMIAASEETAPPGPISQYAEVELAQVRQVLRQVLTELPEQQRVVIAGHYLQGMQFEQIASELRLTKGRISQIHKAALMNLRQQLKKHIGIG